MTTIFQLATVLILSVMIACNSQSNSKAAQGLGDTLAKQNITPTQVDTSRSFLTNYGTNDNNLLFAFVGEKIAIESLPHKRYSMDNSFKAKYLILEKVYGNFLKDTIEFVVYDHYDEPNFSKFNTVLLYVSADSGIYYHQKYMFNDVYKTKDGRWAGTYARQDYEHSNNKRTKIKPVRIEFAQRVAYPTKTEDQDGHQIVYSYPTPYFKTVRDSAFAVYGNYAEDLFILKRDGYLTAREIFKNGKLVQ